MSITDFLLARIAEEEKDAINRVVLRTENRRSLTTDDAEKIHAECAAKRAIVEMHQPYEIVQRMTYGDIHPCLECGSIDDAPVEWPCPTIRTLAAVYADHQDYLDEWRVEVMSDINKYTVREYDANTDPESANRHAVVALNENGEIIYYSPDAVIEIETDR